MTGTRPTFRLRCLAAVGGLALVLTACGDGSPGGLSTPELESPVRVLFIGDSFTEGIDSPFVEFSASTDTPLAFEAEERGSPGTTLEGLWFCCRSVDTIQQGGWRYVVLQGDASFESSDEATFFEYVRLFNEEAQAVGAEMVLYMHWEVGGTDPVRPTAGIADTHKTISEELGVTVAPVGVAWSRVLSDRPELDLYAGDRVHANARGMYLTLAVLYATLLGESPEGATYMGPNLGNLVWVEEASITDEDAAFLQRIAWQTVSEYSASE